MIILTISVPIHFGIYKEDNTWAQVDIKFIFECWTWYIVKHEIYKPSNITIIIIIIIII